MVAELVLEGVREEEEEEEVDEEEDVTEDACRRPKKESVLEALRGRDGVSLPFFPF